MGPMNYSIVIVLRKKNLFDIIARVHQIPEVGQITGLNRHSYKVCFGIFDQFTRDLQRRNPRICESI